MWRYAGVLCLLAVAGASPLSAAPLTEVTFGTNWIAQAEHGGYYQALADGTHRGQMLVEPTLVVLERTANHFNWHLWNVIGNPLPQLNNRNKRAIRVGQAFNITPEEKISRCLPLQKIFSLELRKNW